MPGALSRRHGTGGRTVTAIAYALVEALGQRPQFDRKAHARLMHVVGR
jgi:hypothetical protein